MVESKFPAAPRMPTIPAPKDEDPIHLMRELRAALENAGDLMTRLATKIACLELAMLTDEHKVNTLREDHTALTERVSALEDMAAE